MCFYVFHVSIQLFFALPKVLVVFEGLSKSLIEKTLNLHNFHVLHLNSNLKVLYLNFNPAVEYLQSMYLLWKSFGQIYVLVVSATNKG